MKWFVGEVLYSFFGILLSCTTPAVNIIASFLSGSTSNSFFRYIIFCWRIRSDLCYGENRMLYVSFL